MSLPARNRIAFFIEGDSVPSSRFRVLQYIDVFRQRGYQVTVCATKPNKYLWYPKWVRLVPPLKWLWAICSLLWITVCRIYQIVRFGASADVVVLQRELLYRVPVPYLEALLFWLAPARTRFVFDVDDSVYLTKSGERSKSQDRKLSFICRNCDMIVTGNSFLEEYFRRFAPVAVIPTVVDTNRFERATKSASSDELPVVGWTGVKSNLPSLAGIVGALQEVRADYPFRLLVITDGDADLPRELANFGAELVPWSKENELLDLAKLDIGLMPLPDSDWSRGKCGFKLIQYMATGIASIATPIGVNAKIVRDGENGFVARNSHEWSSALRQLLSDRERREVIAAKGRITVVEQFSLEKWTDRFMSAVVG